MKPSVIGHECSRRTVALIVLVTVIAAAIAACCGPTLLNRPPFDTLPLAPWARGALGGLVCLVLGALALQQAILSSERWELAEETLRYRSPAQRGDLLRYAACALAGRAPEPDVALATPSIRRVELLWHRQVVSLGAAGGLPSVTYPMTVRITLEDGARAEFAGLEQDPATLGAALSWPAGRPGVTLDDPDDLIGAMLDPARSLYDHLAHLDARKGRG